MQTSVARRNNTGGLEKFHLITIPKKGDLTLTKNYRAIALTNHMG